MSPLVSCVMATHDRPDFLRHATACFQRQTYENRELIIVDDGAQPARDNVPAGERIRYLELPSTTCLGTKLNLGIANARGSVIQKLDDDDYYAPGFLATMVARLLSAPKGACNVAGCGEFLVLIADSGRLTTSGRGWCAGGTLCFSRDLWLRQRFRPLVRAIDWFFLKDTCAQVVPVSDPTVYILVRHGRGHLWTHLMGRDVTAYFRQRPRYSRPLAELVPADSLSFYASLRQSAEDLG